MDSLALVLFWSTLFLCLSTYAFYPGVLWVFGKLFPFKVQPGHGAPYVSVIIPAYNEGKNIEQKIENTLELDYERSRLEILVGSDGSIDETAEKAQKYLEEGVQVEDFPVNRGKTVVQNDLVRRSKGEILVFTDAASFLERKSIRKLVENFADVRVGCVAGRMRFVKTNSNKTARGQGLYWKYESKIRELESKLGSLVGADGPLYAVKRGCYVPLGANQISDLINPLLVLAQGKKVILEPCAVVDEVPTFSGENEFSTRRRITVRGLIGLYNNVSLLNPLKHPVMALQIFFHKILRWFVGPLVVIHVVACALLFKFLIFKVLIVLYLSFFLCAGIQLIAERLQLKNPLTVIPYYFCLVNLGATAGIIDFLRKKEIISWNPIRNV